MVYYSGGNRCTGLALRRLLYSKKLDFAMEAHSGLSAKVAAEAGFKALWASGLSISASFGLRDRNEASWTQVTDVAEQIVQAAPGVPVLVDGDTGYGDFNSARRLVQALERAGVAGVSLEDKLFPKTNSFLDGVGGAQQDLADVEEFCLKLRACKEAQSNPHFTLVARVEALIAGAGMDEALYRAEEYRKAGADAILIHSRQKTPDEIKQFCTTWGRKVPLVIVPTTYGVGVSPDEFYDAGADLCIWANQNMRASVAAMRETSTLLHDSEQVLPELEKRITPVKEIFSMMNEGEMSEAELKYTPAAKPMFTPEPSAVPTPERYDGHDYTPSKHISPTACVDALTSLGSKFYAGVPDSLMKPLCNAFAQSKDLKNVITANEGTAVGMAAGHYLATNEVPVVYMQNSGLGNSVNPLLSLVHEDVYSIPMVVLVGWRGESHDEPQHMVQGGCMQQIITDMGFESVILPVTSDEDAIATLKEAHEQAASKLAPVFVLVQKNTFDTSKMVDNSPKGDDLAGPFASNGMSRKDAIKAVHELCPKKDWVRISTTGKPSRELYAITDAEKDASGGANLEDMLVVGSMGHTASIAQGVALGMTREGNTSKNVLCLDGDGSAIMHMGSFSQTGQLKVSNMLHVILNNGTHESVGPELTAASDPAAMDLTGVGKACGYEEVQVANSAEDIAEFVGRFNSSKGSGAWLLDVRVGVSDPNAALPRPKETPKQRKEGVMKHISS